MVKMPSFDDIKKAGAGLIDSAKSIKINEMVDKVKSGIDSVGASLKKDANAVPMSDDDLQNIFKTLYASLAELAQMQGAQAVLIKNIESQLASLAKRIEDKKDVTP